MNPSQQRGNSTGCTCDIHLDGWSIRANKQGGSLVGYRDDKRPQMEQSFDDASRGNNASVRCSESRC